LERSDGRQRKLRNEDLQGLYYTTLIRIIHSRKTRQAGRVARKIKEWNAYKIVVGKYDGKRDVDTV